MTQQGRELMESGTPANEAITDNAASAPSPPRRDSVEDADPSLTRKRPRLDNGAPDEQAMTAFPLPHPEPEPSPTDHDRALPQDQPVQVTIRSQPPSSAQTTDHGKLPAAPTAVDAAGTTDTDAMADPNSSEPPPIISIDSEEEDAAAVVMSVSSDEELDPGAYFLDFPFAELREYDYCASLRQVALHVHTAQQMDGTVLPEITKWLRGLSFPPSQWQEVYRNKRDFWVEFSNFTEKLLERRINFGNGFCAGHQSEADIFYQFFKSYVTLCVRLLEVDTELLSESSTATFSEDQLLSPAYLLPLFAILQPSTRREQSPLYSLFSVLATEYAVNVQLMARHLLSDFLGLPTNGLRRLLDFADAACHKVTPKHTLMSSMTRIINTAGYHVGEAGGTHYYGDVLHYFKSYDALLQVPGNQIDVGATRDLVVWFSTLLNSLCRWDDTIASECAENLLASWRPRAAAGPEDESSSHTLYDDGLADTGILVSTAWKFRLLVKYAKEGRMELRVMSIGFLDNELVGVWRNYHNTTAGDRHPVIQFAADFLLDEKVIDYIISVKSHPQLIQRSGNIVGFLVVSHRYSEQQADAILNVISNTQNLRFVAAALTMLCGIVNLMELRHLVYLCSQLYNLPIESYSPDLLRLLLPLVHEKLGKHVEDLRAGMTRPWNVCIRLIRDTAPSRDSTPLMVDLHREACGQLTKMSESITQEEREHIYRECATYIAERSAKATGALRAIYLLCCYDAEFFQQNPDIVRSILEELCGFVKAENSIGPFGFYPTALDYRLEMLCFLILRAPEAIPKDLYPDIWRHTIGDRALNNNIRDQAWNKLTSIVRRGFNDKRGFNNDFCKQLISICVPRLESQFFTQGLYEFVAAYPFSSAMQAVATEDNSQELVQIPAAELLWQMMMNAPKGTIESSAAELLVRRYLDVDALENATVRDFEHAHVALGEKCVAALLANYRTLRQGSSQEQRAVSEDEMDISLSDTTRKQAELRSGRTIFFMKLLLGKLRSKPEFARCPRPESDVELTEPQGNHGEIIEVTYTSSAGADKKSLFIGTANAVSELETRLHNLTGFTKLKIFFMGRQLNAGDQINRKLEDCGLSRSAHMLVQDSSVGTTHHAIPDTSRGSSVFEATLLEHFDELFACMDSSDEKSAVLFSLLEELPPPPATVSNDVGVGTGSADCTFPPGKPFQAEYSAYALRYRLQRQIRKAALDDEFLLNAVQLLDKAILNPKLVSDSLTGKCDLRLASVLVSTLLEFLKERPEKAISSRYFSDESMLVERLCKMLVTALTSPSDQLSLACSSYAVILEASLHSGAIWNIFMSRADKHDVHRVLLLSDPRKKLRENIVRFIASLCGGGLPITSSLTEAETANGFWRIVSAILPHAIRYRSQSEQLFILADQLFRSYDEHFREEQSLRAYLASWGELLLQYQHAEVVGRGDVDVVVLGLTKLMLSCVASLKSFKKPLDAVPLMRGIYEKFLFMPRITEMEDDAMQECGVPVLESSARRELYDLVHALTEDRNGLDALLELTDGLIDDEMSDSRLVGFDRTDFIRSPTGYVGLFNPKAICYMNSLLTQLFMNINFRGFILGLHVADPDNSQRLLFETQKLFTKMQNSYRKAADPRDFAACVKGTDGLPLNLAIQMDADEFYNLLFDQMEGQLLKPQDKQQFRSFYGGQTINQIKSKECKHVSERVEPFFVVQCDVVGKSNLGESLRAFVEGDVMEGENKYKCESCGGKFVDAVKRTCLKEVPDNLILHLKRFDFDLVDMVRRKINGHFPFPMDIDVSAYHVDHLSDPSKPRQEDIFDLVGILVHQGTSEQGHYYSYIRERPYQCGSMTGWVEFNDRDVDVFDDTQIPFSTWGGQFDEFPQQEKLFSAYMLFYQRREAIQRDRREYAGVLQREPAKVPAPQNLRQSIALDNDKVLREYCLHNVEHSKFVRHMLSTLRTVNNGNCSEDHKQEEKCLRIALGHICLILARQKNIEYFEELTNQLRKSLLSCGTCCGIGLKWLATSPAALYVSLFRSPHAKVRSQTGVSLIECLLFLRSQEPLLYYGSDVDTENATGTPGQGVLVDVIQCLRTVYDDSWVSARGWDDLHLTLCQIARIGPIEVAVLLTHGFLEKPLKVFCMHAWEELRGEDPDVWRAVDSAKKSHLARLSRLVELVCLLLSHMDIQLQAESDSFYAFDRLAQYNRSNSRFSLSRHEKTLLTFWDESLKAYAALDKMLEIYDPFKNKVYNALEMMMETYDASKSDIFYPGEILKWMFETGDERMKGKLFRMLREGIVSLDSPWIDPYLRAAINFLEVCPDATCATKIVEQATIKAYAFRDEKEDKSTWEVHLDFLSALVTLQAPALATSGTTADVLCQHILTRVPSYGPTLFLYAKENTRNAMARHLHRLCHVVKSPEYSDDTVRLKYRSIRMLLRDMIQLFINERYAGIAREFLEPLIVSCGMLAKQLSTLHDEGSPLAAYKDQADIALLSRYEEQVETQIMDWHQDDDVPISAGGRVIRRASNASSMTIEATEFALENFETESEELDHLES